MEKIVLYTDGACSGNPGVGGYAAIISIKDRPNVHKKIVGGEKLTTNNRMELMAVIKGLQALKKPCEVEVYSDSAYVIKAFNDGWLNNWVLNNWQTKGKTPVSNKELWEELLKLINIHSVTWHKVKGHSDNPLNNECDALARAEITKIKNQDN